MGHINPLALCELDDVSGEKARERGLGQADINLAVCQDWELSKTRPPRAAGLPAPSWVRPRGLAGPAHTGRGHCGHVFGAR